MTGRQFSKALEELGYTSGSDFAEQLELTRQTVNRWRGGKWPVPPHISALIKLMLKTGTSRDQLVT
jgi:transcriptional regulator with XRE-family HTH domain